MSESRFSIAVDGLNLETTSFVVLALGSLKMIAGKLPYFLDVGSEPALDRIVRQITERGGETTIYTNQLPILESYDNAIMVKFRGDREGLKLLASRDSWSRKRTVILYGDAVYSDETIDRITLIDTDMAMFGDYEQILAYSFIAKNYSKFEKCVTRWSDFLDGDTNYIYRGWTGLEVMENVYEPYGEDMTVYRPLDDYSCRFRGIRDYMDFLSKRARL